MGNDYCTPCEMAKKGVLNESKNRAIKEGKPIYKKMGLSFFAIGIRPTGKARYVHVHPDNVGQLQEVRYYSTV